MANIGAKVFSSAVVGELQRPANFSVDIPGLDVNVTLLISKVPLPVSSSEEITIKHGNSQIKLPGAGSFDSGEFTIYDSITNDTEMALQKWREQVFNSKTEEIGLQNVIKKDIIVTEYTPNGTLGRQWKYEGCWPAKFDPGSLDATSSGEVKTMTLTIAYDRAYRI